MEESDVNDSFDPEDLQTNMKENTDFDFEEFCKNMQKCITENASEVGDVDLKFYLLAYDQLYK